MGLELGGAGGAYALLDLLGQPGQVVLGDRPALAGLADAGEHLVAAERLGGAGALDHGEARGLDGREPAAALGHCRRRRIGGAVVGRTAVDDAGVLWRQNGQCISGTPFGVLRLL